MGGNVTILIECLTLFLFFLKICEFVDLNWFLVLAPMFGFILLKVFVFLAFNLCAYLAQDNIKQLERLWEENQHD